MIIQSETKSTLMTDHEELFEKYIDYPFHKLMGENYNKTPISTLISYNPNLGSGLCTIKLYKNSKTVVGRLDKVEKIITEKIWKGVE